MKTCTKCKKYKELNCFSKQKTGKLGVRSICKECNRGTSNDKLLNRKCLFCNNTMNTLTSYKKYCNSNCKQKHYRNKNPQQNYLTNKKWKKLNKDHINSQSRKAYSINPSKYIAKTRKRQAQKLNATLLGYDLELENIYLSCPKGSEVHHIIPLQEFSDTVSGLHVPWNLQILTKEEHVKAHRLLKSRFS